VTFPPFSRRRFLARTSAAAAAAWISPAFLSAARAAGGTVNLPAIGHLDLNGDWQVAQEGKDDWIPARVPGCIHTDLLAARKIPDPFYRENEQAVQWVGETNWIYRRRFDAPPDLLARDRVLLRCDGLDTLATLKLNGQEIGRANNMFRVWEFDVKPSLQAGENEIEITFASPLPYLREMEAKRKLPEWAGWHEPKGRAWVRKEPCNFGWDWAPVLITCGIWRNIGLRGFDQARLDDILILQNHSAGKVELEIQITAEVLRQEPLPAGVRVLHQEREIAATKTELTNGRGRVVLTIGNPKLWWPAGLGAQPLYEVRVELRDAGGKILDRANKRIGLRTLKLLAPDAENPLRFEVNGVPFFAKGANWIPADSFAPRVTPEKLRRYVADAVAVNMNMLRFWGGGYYEEDALYDVCDEAGVCVWVDFKFACSSYPAFDAAFMENVRREVRDNLRRLRHHPCIAVWCGNNEISLLTKSEWSDDAMGRADYDKLFKDLIGGQVAELAPQANYVSGSPECGDTHYWEVWHGRNLPFSAYRTQSGFMSEFGFQSFPEPKTVRAFTNETDRVSVTSPVVEWHQRDGSQKGNEIIRDTTLRYFKPPKDFDSALWLSQILQALAIQTGAEYWRQTMPRSMGCLFWQYNDCWPAVTWSSVDYFGRWKALHYRARHFYAPLLVSGLEHPDAGAIDLFVTSDRPEACRGTLHWRATDALGRSLTHGSLSLEIPPRASRKVQTLDLHPLCRKHGAHNVLTWLKLEVAGKTESENLVLFVPPKDVPLADPQIKTEISAAPGGFRVTLTAEKPALWAWLSLEDADAKYSDNFVHLAAGESRPIFIRPSAPLTKTDFAKNLRVRSLFDTCS
jgi:beta-mannosidase